MGYVPNKFGDITRERLHTITFTLRHIYKCGLHAHAKRAHAHPRVAVRAAAVFDTKNNNLSSLMP